MIQLAILLPLLATQAAEIEAPPTRPIRVGESVQSAIRADAPLVAGRLSERFELAANGPPRVTITLRSFDFDVVLRIETTQGVLLAEDDDSGTETDAWAILADRGSQPVILIASAKEGEGEFTLGIQAEELVPPTGALALDESIAWRTTAAERALARGDKRAAAGHRLLEGRRRRDRLQLDAAREAFEESLALARELEDREMERKALTPLALTFRALGDLPRAQENCEHSLQIARELGDRAEEAAALINLGTICTDLQERDRARQLYEQGLEIAQQVGHRRWEAMALRNLGGNDLKDGNHLLARERLEKSLGLVRELGDRAEEAVVVGKLCIVMRALGDSQRAQEFGEQQLTLGRELRNRVQEAQALINLGLVSADLLERSRARGLFEQGLEIASRIGQQRLEASALRGLGQLDNHEGHHVLARERLERSLDLVRELKDRAEEAEVVGWLCIVAKNQRDLPRACEFGEQHLVIARELGDLAGEAAALVNIGTVYEQLRERDRAREFYEQGLDIARRIGHRKWEGIALRNLGTDDGRNGDHLLARKRLEESLVIARELGDREEEAVVVGNFCVSAAALGDFGGARELAEQHLALTRTLGDRTAEARALGNLGSVHSYAGDFARARELLQDQVALAREFGDRAGEAAALGNLGVVLWQLGDFVRAREHQELSLDLARAIGDNLVESRAHSNLGNLAYSLGEFVNARVHHERHLALARKLGDPAAEAAALINLGSAHEAMKEYSGARALFQQGLDAARNISHRLWEANALINLATLHLALGEAVRAQELAKAAGMLARDIGSKECALLAGLASAGASIMAGDSSGAQTSLDECERSIGDLANGLEIAELGSLRGRFSTLGELSQDLTALRAGEARDDRSMREGALRWGFAAAGRWKGRALLEGIAEHRAGARSAEAIGLRRARREALAGNSALLAEVANARHTQKPTEEIKGLLVRAAAKQIEAEALLAKLRDVSPMDAELDLPLGAPLEDVRRAAVGTKSLLVEYVEGEKQVYAYVLERDRLDFVELGTQTEVRAEVDAFLDRVQLVGRLAGPAEIGDAGHALFERLLKPALALSKNPVEELVIVPCAALASLPFEALVVENPAQSPSSFDELSFVLDRFEVTYGPSAPVLVELAANGARRKPGKLLVLADPRYRSEGEAVADSSPTGAVYRRGVPEKASFDRLVGTRDEALAIARLVTADRSAEIAGLRSRRSGSLALDQVDVHVGDRASRASLDGDLRGYSVLHLACHGFIDAEHPEQSGIALSPTAEDEGWFTIHDALELDLDADLVVLSACETARGQAKAGEGIESLARAFLYAGARGLVASLWKVDDRAAATTMEAFYRGWLLSGRSAAEALRGAKLELRRGRIDPRAPRGVGVGASAKDRVAEAATGHPYYWAPFIHIGLPR